MYFLGATMKALAGATGIVFWTLVLGTVVLMFFPGGNAGEPDASVAVLSSDPNALVGRQCTRNLPLTKQSA